MSAATGWFTTIGMMGSVVMIVNAVLFVFLGSWFAYLIRRVIGLSRIIYRSYEIQIRTYGCRPCNNSFTALSCTLPALPFLASFPPVV